MAAAASPPLMPPATPPSTASTAAVTPQPAFLAFSPTFSAWTDDSSESTLNCHYDPSSSASSSSTPTPPPTATLTSMQQQSGSQQQPHSSSIPVYAVAAKPPLSPLITDRSTSSSASSSPASSAATPRPRRRSPNVPACTHSNHPHPLVTSTGVPLRSILKNPLPPTSATEPAAPTPSASTTGTGMPSLKDTFTTLARKFSFKSHSAKKSKAADALTDPAQPTPEPQPAADTARCGSAAGNGGIVGGRLARANSDPNGRRRRRGGAASTPEKPAAASKRWSMTLGSVPWAASAAPLEADPPTEPASLEASEEDDGTATPVLRDSPVPAPAAVKKLRVTFDVRPPASCSVEDHWRRVTGWDEESDDEEEEEEPGPSGAVRDSTATLVAQTPATEATRRSSSSSTASSVSSTDPPPSTASSAGGSSLASLASSSAAAQHLDIPRSTTTTTPTPSHPPATPSSFPSNPSPEPSFWPHPPTSPHLNRALAAPREDWHYLEWLDHWSEPDEDLRLAANNGRHAGGGFWYGYGSSGGATPTSPTRAMRVFEYPFGPPPYETEAGGPWSTGVRRKGAAGPSPLGRREEEESGKSGGGFLAMAAGVGMALAGASGGLTVGGAGGYGGL
ncbi:hypothetical protein HDU96_003693 [Phlyctochytrium bullatum]|nr:hypothetical protein HDU96_003693 [Phlyctochytrium bullatum]